MRKFLIFLAWLGLIGAVTDSAITLFAAWEVINSSELGLGLSVDQHLRSHLYFLYWLKDVAYVLAPDPFIDWLFDLPALAYFPFRVFLNLLFGWWMFRWARKLERT